MAKMIASITSAVVTLAAFVVILPAIRSSGTKKFREALALARK